jgi:hypothetical protein
MIDIWDMLHYLVGFIILGLFLYFIIQTNNYFSKDNIVIVPSNLKT